MKTTQKLPRIVLIDSVRGFALAGVALVHFTQKYITFHAPEGFMEDLNSLPDHIASGLVSLLFVGKFYALFSILFGLSFSIMMQSAEQRNEDFSLRFLWRAALLFIIGYGHHLFYGGDILMIYAVLAPFIIPFYKLKNKWSLIIAGIMFVGIPNLITSVIMGDYGMFGSSGMDGAGNPENMKIFNALYSGSIIDVFRINILYGMKAQFGFQLFSGRMFQTFGYFLLGLFFGKIGLFRNIEKFISHIKKVMKWAALTIIIIAGLGLLIFLLLPKPVENTSTWIMMVGMNLLNLINFAMSAIILGAFILLYQRSKWQKRLSFFSPYGRMALTNYVFQAIIATSVLYGWGLGLLDQIRTMYMLLLAIVVVIIQTWLSKIWLNNFRYGPLEWLWRCGTYLKIQPLRKDSGTLSEPVKENTHSSPENPELIFTD